MVPSVLFRPGDAELQGAAQVLEEAVGQKSGLGTLLGGVRACRFRIVLVILVEIYLQDSSICLQFIRRVAPGMKLLELRSIRSSVSSALK